MFQEQARHERFVTTKALTSCKMAPGTLVSVLEIIAQSTQRNKQKILCKHSIQQPMIARLIKDQILTSIVCAEID